MPHHRSPTLAPLSRRGRTPERLSSGPRTLSLQRDESRILEHRMINVAIEHQTTIWGSEVRILPGAPDNKINHLGGLLATLATVIGDRSNDCSSQLHKTR